MYRTVVIGCLSVGSVFAFTACAGTEDRATPATVTVTASSDPQTPASPGIGANLAVPTTPAQIATTVLPSTETVATEIDWLYLQREYSQFLGRTCDEAVKSEDGASCFIRMHIELEAFERDAQELPPSKERSELLEAVESFREHYTDWEMYDCPHGAPTDCVSQPYLMGMTHDLIAGKVNHNAANG